MQAAFVVTVKEQTHRTPTQLISFAIGVLLIFGLSVSQHRHHIGERCPWTVVLVGINEDSKPFKFIRGPEDLAALGALFGQPHGHAIAVEIVCACDGEFDFDLRQAQLLACVSEL